MTLKYIITFLMVFNIFGSSSVSVSDINDLKDHQVRNLYNKIQPTKKVSDCSTRHIGNALAFGLTFFMGGRSGGSSCSTTTVDIPFDEWRDGFKYKVGQGLTYTSRDGLLVPDEFKSEVLKNPLYKSLEIKLESLNFFKGDENGCLLLSDTLILENKNEKKIMKDHYNSQRNRIELLEEIIANEQNISVNLLRHNLKNKIKIPQYTINYDLLSSKFEYALDEDIIFNNIAFNICDDVSNSQKKKILKSAISKTELAKFYKEYVDAMIILDSYKVYLVNVLLKYTSDDISLDSVSNRKQSNKTNTISAIKENTGIPHRSINK